MKSIKREARKGIRPHAAAGTPAGEWSRVAGHASGIVVLSIEPGDLRRDAGHASSQSGSTARSKHA
ncbi:hypothetical protein [Dyella sp.]|jgi:hypothetical protein|uniref:hypothetical protein n=1 Tax=Dyella sp. TaxID=1869338 RepID=UPI002D77C227|nr:hypothetical protein [Dyella sp.]HET6431124.1 hypothetical protein [Dyella sp.]